VQEPRGSAARQIAKLPNGNIPYDRGRSQFMKEGWSGLGSYLLSHFPEFKSSLIQKFEVFLGVWSFLGVL